MGTKQVARSVVR